MYQTTKLLSIIFISVSFSSGESFDIRQIK
nr:MAG TPA: hypothetical protein [Caudoviricetes sp.]